MLPVISGTQGTGRARSSKASKSMPPKKLCERTYRPAEHGHAGTPLLAHNWLPPVARLAVASAPRAEPRGVRLRQQLRDQVPRLPRAVGRRLVPAAHDRVVDVHVRVGAEGRAAAEHLVDQDAETPPVARECVPAVRYNLGREVLGCAAQRVRAVLNHLRECPGSDRQGSSGARERRCALAKPMSMSLR